MDLIDLVKSEFKKVHAVAEENRRTLQEQQQHITSVEAKMNTAPTISTLYQTDTRRVAEKIPEHLRKHVEMAERKGLDNPAMVTAKGAWLHLQYKGQMSMFQRNERPTNEWNEMLHSMEKALGFEPEYIKAGLGEDTFGQGGALIPTPFERDLQRLIQDNGAMREIAARIPMTSKTHKIPTEANNVFAYFVPEAVTIGDAMATTAFGNADLTAKKIAGIATISNELLEDNIVAVGQYIFAAVAEQIARLEDREGLDGTGVNFTGLANVAGVNSATVTGTAASGGVKPTYDDLVKLAFLAQQSASRQNGVFIAHPGTWRHIVALVDAQGSPIFQFAGGIPNAVPNRILGYDVFLSSAVSTTNSLYTSSANLYFGPRGKIVFGDLGALRMDLDPFSLFSSFQTKIRVLERVGIVCPVGKAFSYLKGCAYSG